MKYVYLSCVLLLGMAGVAAWFHWPKTIELPHRRVETVDIFVRYVSPLGNDANDGYFRERPKLTIGAAIAALPDGGKTCGAWMSEPVCWEIPPLSKPPTPPSEGDKE